jgi:hypothetical protein
MNIYCDRYSECRSIFLDRSTGRSGEPTTESMAQARGWVIWRGTTMGGKQQEVKLCDKCIEASRRMLRQHRYETLPGQYPIPELTVVRMDEETSG